MGRGVPQDVAAVVAVGADDTDVIAVVDRSAEVGGDSVDLGGHRHLGETTRDRLGQVGDRRAFLEVATGTIGENDRNLCHEDDSVRSVARGDRSIRRFAVESIRAAVVDDDG